MMKLAEIKTMAKDLGVKPGKLVKTELIHRIQEAEGNYPCFGTAAGNCNQMDCCWRADCI